MTTTTIKHMVPAEIQRVAREEGVRAAVMRCGIEFDPGELSESSGWGNDLQAWYGSEATAWPSMLALAAAAGVPTELLLDAVANLIQSVPCTYQDNPVIDEALTRGPITEGQFVSRQSKLTAYKVFVQASMPLARLTASTVNMLTIETFKTKAASDWLWGHGMHHCPCEGLGGGSDRGRRAAGPDQRAQQQLAVRGAARADALSGGLHAGHLGSGLQGVTGYLPGLEGAELRRDLSQFYTPPDLALQLWSFALQGGKVDRLVEPAAGLGALLRPVFADTMERVVTAVDADPRNVEAVRAMDWGQCAVASLCCDFLHLEPQLCDLALQNTPFEDGQDVAFVERALLWAPRVVGIFPAGMMYSEGRLAFWRRVKPTRIVHLSKRPLFGVVAGSDGPKTNFMVLELAKRRGLEVYRPTVEWW